MQALPLDELPSRVVAWHNRHPLARRIRASQVHSVGTVLLPFASARPWPGDPAAAAVAPPRPRAGPSLAEVVSARAAARPGAQGSASKERAAAPTGRGPSAAAAAAAVAPRPAGWLRQGLLRLTGLGAGPPRLVAAFDRDVVWPLTLAQVARWARRHGQAVLGASGDTPHRDVAPDPTRLAALRRKGLHETVHLQLLTAAIGVGDQRLRLLLDRHGHVVGPRAYSRPRAAGAGGLCVAGLLALVGPWLLPDPTMPAGSAVPAAAASSASAPGSTLLAGSSPVVASAPAPTMAAVASAPDSARPAPAAAAASAAPERPAVAAAGTHAVPDSSAATGLAKARPAEAPVRIRPSLSDDEKQAARDASARARGQIPATPAPVVPPAAAVYAVVSQPSARRDIAAGGLALMQSARARLTPPAPDRGDLMHSQGVWRAAWWPFASLADAERARVMLAGLGMKAEVVEF